MSFFLSSETFSGLYSKEPYMPISLYPVLLVVLHYTNTNKKVDVLKNSWLPCHREWFSVTTAQPVTLNTCSNDEHHPGLLTHNYLYLLLCILETKDSCPWGLMQVCGLCHCRRWQWKWLQRGEYEQVVFQQEKRQINRFFLSNIINAIGSYITKSRASTSRTIL